ncbi:hypothetical protein K8S19_11495 [bacterium]|nr:hypothetical protein [bacterium]
MDISSLNIYGLPHLFISFFILWIGLHRLLRPHPIGIPFALLCFSLFTWNIGIALNFFSHTDPFIHTFRRIYYLGICFLPVCFFYYSISFLKNFTRKTRLLLWVLIATSAFFFITALTNFHFVIGSHHHFFGYYAKFGYLGWFFLLYMYLSMFGTFFMWVRFYRKEADAIHRRRIQIISMGLLLFAPTTIDFFPTLGYAVFPFGVFFALLFLLFQAYAAFTFRIIQLQNISSILFQHSSVLICAILPWGLFSFIFFKIFSDYFYQVMLGFIVFSFLASIPYIHFVIPWLTRHLFHKEYAFHLILQAFLHEMYHLKTIHKLMHYIRQMIKKTLHIPHILMVYGDPDLTTYKILASQDTASVCPEALVNLLPWLREHPKILFRYDVNFFHEFSSIRPIAQLAFERVDAEIFIPLLHAKQLLGIIIIGKNPTHDFFNHLEISFLNQLKSIATIAIHNAYLYECIRKLSKTLWEGNINLNEKVRNKTHALETALKQIQTLNEEQSDFFTMASHNLRTPLTAIKVAATLLWGTTADATSKNNDLTLVMQNNVRRLEMLIRYIIEIVRMEDGKQEFIDGSAMIFSSVKGTLHHDP